MLNDIHKRKIDMADGIYVIDVDRNIGSSTLFETAFANATGKNVRYLEDPVNCYIPAIDFDKAFATWSGEIKIFINTQI